MTEKRTLDTAKIRTAGAEVAEIVKVLQGKHHELHACFNRLHDEMYCADPVRDGEFDKFLLEIARAKNALDNLWALGAAAGKMKVYGLENAAPTVAVQRESMVPNVGATFTAPILSVG